VSVSKDISDGAAQALMEQLLDDSDLKGVDQLAIVERLEKIEEIESQSEGQEASLKQEKSGQSSK